MKELTTEVWSLNFQLKGDKLCFITRTPQGEKKRYTTTLPPRMAAAVAKQVDAHLKQEERIAAMTPAEKAEHYAEMMGS